VEELEPVRLVLAGVLAALTATSLAVIRPALTTDEERIAAESIGERRLRADVRWLSSDLLEGRAPGSRGDRLAREYVAARFEAAGLEPGIGSAWEQPVELVGMTAQAPEKLRVSREVEALTLRLRDDYIAYSGSPDSEVRLDDAEIVFVGYGIVAPEHAWDDYKDADLRGKVLLVMNNDPERDPGLFAGKRRLYYGRWDYKYLMAAERGASGAIVIHTDASAGYSWSVVQNSWSGEQLSLPASGEAVLPLKAWATEDASRRIARLAGHDLDVLRAQAESRDFRPVSLGVRLSVLLKNEVVRRTSANVVGRLTGSDRALAKEAVLYTAHHDHYGIKPSADGSPAIYNGALDNASGVATLLAVAEAFAALEKRPRRSILFASVTAEEQGLLGSQYLARHLPLHPGLVAANVNIDGANIWGRTRDVPVIGLGKSSLDDWIRAIAEMQGRRVVPEAFPDKGSYYRSDHLSFARLGVPAAYLEAGTEMVGRPPGWGRDKRQAWQEAHYHQPSDDLTPDWNFEGVVEDARLLFLLGVKVANAPRAPTWRPGDEFEAARRKALAEVGR
jgi:Zn-dependent M28 family amino/carboxypeptidase